MTLRPWREAEEARDRPALEEFVCTLPPPPPKMSWEKSVQKFFQTQVWDRLKDLCDAEPHLRITEDEAGIAAAYTLNRWEAPFPEYSPVEGFGNQLIGFLAIAARHRCLDGAVANEALSDALYTALEIEKDAAQGVYVWAKVHRKNKASKRMLTRHEFRYATRIDDDGAYEHWGRKIDREPLDRLF